MIGERCGVLLSSSKIYETEPWGFIADNNFLNQVVLIETELEPHVLLKELLSIEAALGRQRNENIKGYSSRPMDLDVLYYGDLIINDEDLILPHPRLHLRRFTLLPLCDVAPDFEHPVFKKTNKNLLEECEDVSEVTLLVRS
jgi:2-amino-4-hydroxy-6-hydroxymethyldihydropteridine diphosphokinase